MISAKDLRKEYTNVLYASSVAAELAKLDPIIRAAAARGERLVAFRGFGFESINPYTQKFNPAQKLMVERLSNLGYAVELKFVVRQLVDVWLEISW